MRVKHYILIFEKMQQQQITSRENMSGKDNKKGEKLDERRNIIIFRNTD